MAKVELIDISRVPEFLNLLYSQVDKGIYVWGANGTALTPTNYKAFIERREAKVADEKRDIAMYKKRVKAGVKEIRAFDCSGLVYWALRTMGLQNTDISSRGFYDVCKKIKKADLKPGDLVFHSQTGGRIVHVGVYYGAGKYIEARGRDYGVVCNKRPSTYWDKFGRYTKLYEAQTIDIGAPEPITMIKIIGGSVYVRTKPNTTDGVIIGVAHKGERYPVIGVAENGWYNIKFEGKSGYISNRSDLTEVYK